jgi:hypothetical protein
MAATGTSSPVPPGIPRDPGPGQYYASPALAALLRSTPANQLADRYPGHLAGTIGDAAMFASEAQQHPMVAPGAAYYLLTAGGIAVSLGIIAATFPLLARLTGPEVARNE